MVLEKASGYVAAQEAARMLGVNKRAVRNLIARGRLETKKDGGTTAPPLVSVASLERLRSEQ